MRYASFIGAILLAGSHVAVAASWSFKQSTDPFTDTQNVTVEATGHDGGGFLAQCYESQTKLYLRTDERLDTRDILGSVLSFEQITHYRLRVDHKQVISGHADFDHVITRNGMLFVGVQGGDVLSVIQALAKGTVLVYQLRPPTGRVFTVPLVKGVQYIRSLVVQCRKEQIAKAAAKRKAEQQAAKKKAAEEAKRMAQQEAKAKAKAAAQAAAKKMAHQEAKRKAEQAKKQVAEEQRKKKLAERRKALLQELAGQQNPAPQGKNQAQMSKFLAQYTAAIQQKVLQNWLRPPGVTGEVKCQVTVEQSHAGDVLSAKMEKSCGSPVLNRSVENAVKRASPLPAPPDPSVFQRTMVFNFDSSGG